MERTGLLWFACALAVIGIAPGQAPASEIVLHSFGCPPKGANPYAGVIRDSAGNLYGTAANGGAANKGVVFKLDTSGHQTVLYSFTGGADGGYPYAGVIRDSAGNLYGTTYLGGTANVGVVYKIDTTGQETVLYTFTGGADGSYPYAGVIRDSAGNLYGTTYGGGAGAGVVYKLDTTGQESVLHSFAAAADGANPYAGVIRDSAGNLYGTTVNGGLPDRGVVYKVDATGHEAVLYAFTGGADGSNPYAGVIRDSAGNLYGTTEGGGTVYSGVIYKLDTAGQETVLCNFSGVGASNPYAGVIGDSAGNLYGSTYYGGTAGGGVVYKLDTTGQATVLYNFPSGSNGRNTEAGVIRDSAGNLYGTTNQGGTAAYGVVYKLDTTGQATVLFSFPNPVDGSIPFNAGVVGDSAGNLYGTTANGGVANKGVVYKLDVTGQETVLHSFTGGAGGQHSHTGVIHDAAGNFYGTAGGGTAGYGVVYKLDVTGQETVLHSFTGGADGAHPQAGVIRDPAGNLYGTTYSGGRGFGVVYRLDTTGQETVLYSFTGGADGRSPQAGVILDSAGNLYGTTFAGGSANWGVVYRLDTTGQETVLHSFTGGADGGWPYAGVILDSDGNLYGTTSNGGTGAGVVYELDTTGHEAVLHTFGSGADGGYPYAGVIRDSAGNLYGTTQYGGTAYKGIVYKLDSTGHETVLYNFTGGADGSEPWAGVVRDPAGNLYGTTYQGGTRGTGVVFKIKP